MSVPKGRWCTCRDKLPDVGCRVRLEVQGGDGKKLQVVAEVLRIERDPGHPLAALQLLGETDEWRGLIWEPAAPRIFTPPVIESDEEEEEAEDDDELTN